MKFSCFSFVNYSITIFVCPFCVRIRTAAGTIHIAAGCPCILIYFRISEVIPWVILINNAYGSTLNVHSCLSKDVTVLATAKYRSLDDGSVGSVILSTNVNNGTFHPCHLVVWVFKCVTCRTYT